MCGQGDVQNLEDWKKTHTIQMLKREVEQKGYSAVTVRASSQPPTQGLVTTPCP